MTPCKTFTPKKNKKSFFSCLRKTGQKAGNMSKARSSGSVCSMCSDLFLEEGGDTKYLRKFQHTPVSHIPGNPFHPQMKRIPNYKLLVEGLGYVPGLCWKILGKSWNKFPRIPSCPGVDFCCRKMCLRKFFRSGLTLCTQKTKTKK